MHLHFVRRAISSVLIKKKKKKTQGNFWSDGYGGGFLGIFWACDQTHQIVYVKYMQDFCVSIIIIISKETLKSHLKSLQPKNKNGFQTLKKEKIGSGWIPLLQLTFKNKQRRLKGRKQWD